MFDVCGETAKEILAEDAYLLNAGKVYDVTDFLDGEQHSMLVDLQRSRSTSWHCKIIPV